MFSLLVAVGSPAASLSGSAADARTGGGCSPGILTVSHSAVPTKQAGGKRNTVPVAWLQIHYVINSVCITYTHTHTHMHTRTHTHMHMHMHMHTHHAHTHTHTHTRTHAHTHTHTHTHAHVSVLDRLP